MRIEEVTSKENWENFIKENNPQSFFQSWNWGEVIVKSQKSTHSASSGLMLSKVEASKVKSQHLWRMGLYEANKLIGVAQVVKVSARRGSFLHIRHGPILVSWKSHTFSFLIDQLKR